MHQGPRRAALALLRHGGAASSAGGPGAAAAARSVLPRPTPVVSLSARSQQQDASSASDGVNVSGTAGGYMEEMYEAWQRDPASVHSSWDAYFRGSGYAAPPTVGDTRPNTGEKCTSIVHILSWNLKCSCEL